MRDIFFRAWAKHTINNRFNYAWDMAKQEFDPTEPSKNSSEWDSWYEKRENCYYKFLSEWDQVHNQDEEYTETYKMISDISVNGKVQRPYGYDIISVMQYVGFCDKNGKQIFEGDIDRSGYVVTYLADLNAGLGMNAGWYLQRDDFESWSELVCNEDIEIVGNIFENPELAINNCNTDYTSLFE